MNEDRVREIVSTLDYFLNPDDVIEIRAIRSRTEISSGYFRNRETAALNALDLEGWAKGLYFIPNKIKKSPDGRKFDEMGRGDCCDDIDIEERRWLLIDADPIRKANTSSTNDEKKSAIDGINGVVKELDLFGFTGCALGDSGNGAHANYPLILPNDDASKHLIESFLRGLAKRFTTKLVNFDTSIGNASRIWKLYGTLTCKGENTRERPHRRAVLLGNRERNRQIDNAGVLKSLIQQWEIDDKLEQEEEDSSKHKNAWKETATSGDPEKAYVNKALMLQVARVRNAVNGTLWHTLRSAATSLGRFHPRYLSEKDIAEPLYEAAKAADAQDLKHAEKTIATGIAKGAKSPRVVPEFKRQDDNQGGASGKASEPPKPPIIIPPYAPFPVSALPKTLQGFVIEASDAIGCDPSFIALPALTTAAGLVGTARRIRLKRSWTEPAVIWSAIVADPSSMKTPAFNQVRYPLIVLQEEHDEKYATAAAEWQNAVAAWKSKKDDPDRGPEPKAPCKREIFLSDCTIERLGEILHSNPRGALFARDELSAWFGSFTKYKGKNGGSDVSNWLELWQAGCLKIHRKMAVPRDLFVKKAVCSITGGIQPGILSSCLSTELFEAGAPARLLFAMPPTRLKQWREIEVSEEAEQHWAAICRALADLSGEEVLRMSPEAKLLWVEFFNRNANRQFDESGAMRAALGKIEAYGARLALVHYLITAADQFGNEARGTIPAESMSAGICLADWFAHEAERVVLMLNETDADSEVRKLVEKIRSRGGRITARDLMRSNNKRYRSILDAEADLNMMCRAGLGKWEITGKTREFVLHEKAAA